MTNETCRSCLKDGFDMKSLFTRGMICKKILSLRDLLLTCADLEVYISFLFTFAIYLLLYIYLNLHKFICRLIVMMDFLNIFVNLVSI